MELIKLAHEDELKSLKERLSDHVREGRQREMRIDDLIETQKQYALLQEQHHSLVESEATSRKKLDDAESDLVHQRQSDKELLEKLLAEQRKSFEDEQAAVRKALKERHAERKAADDEIANLTGAAAAAKAEAEREQRALKDEISKLQKELKALQKPVKKKEDPAVKKKTYSPLGHIDLDEGPDAPPISQQIAAGLKKNSARVLDLFRSWDTDGDGEVSRSEFHRAMPELGLEVPKRDIDELFDEWDKGGDGALNLKDLQRILAQANVASKMPSPGGGGKMPSVSTAAAVSSAAITLGKLGKKS